MEKKSVESPLIKARKVMQLANISCYDQYRVIDGHFPGYVIGRKRSDRRLLTESNVSTVKREAEVAMLAAVVFMICIGVDALGQATATWVQEATFRMSKLNFIWSKAANHLADKALIKRLKGELDKFDALYLSAKSTSMKNEKYFFDELDRKLEQLLKKYDLESAVIAYNRKYKWRNEEEMKKENMVLSSEKFADSKLQKLWYAAQNSHFSEAALKALHKELKDHEQKMELYEQKLVHFNELNNNALDEDALEASNKLNRELKEHHKSIVDSYDKLHQQVAQMSQNMFSNEKVEKLWRIAVQNPNFTSSELESIRIELNHFDKRLEKLKYHDEELLEAKKKHENLGKFNVFDEDISTFEEENKRLARKLRKLENHLEKRIIHSEL